MKTCHFHTLNLRSVIILLPILVSLAIIMTSCAFNVPAVDPSKRQTDVARSVESTLNAEKVATYQAATDAGRRSTHRCSGRKLPTPTPPSRPNRPPWMPNPPHCLPRRPSPLPQIRHRSLQLSRLLASVDPIQILDWKMAFWVSLPNGCKGNAPCWRTNDDYKKHLGLSPMVLTSQQSYLIDPSWPKPYLVFMTKRKISNPATVELIIDGTPIIVKQYPKGSERMDK